MIYYLLCERDQIKLVDNGSNEAIKNYSLIEESLSSNLGFYNWIIRADLSLAGVNFLLIEEYNPIFDYFLSAGYGNVKIENNEINIFFLQTTDFSIDYSNEFVNFKYLKSETGNIALSFEIPDEFEYKKDFLLKYMQA